MIVLDTLAKFEELTIVTGLNKGKAYPVPLPLTIISNTFGVSRINRTETANMPIKQLQQKNTTVQSGGTPKDVLTGVIFLGGDNSTASTKTTNPDVRYLIMPGNRTFTLSYRISKDSVITPTIKNTLEFVKADPTDTEFWYTSYNTILTNLRLKTYTLDTSKTDSMITFSFESLIDNFVIADEAQKTTGVKV